MRSLIKTILDVRLMNGKTTKACISFPYLPKETTDIERILKLKIFPFRLALQFKMTVFSTVRIAYNFQNVMTTVTKTNIIIEKNKTK